MDGIGCGGLDIEFGNDDGDFGGDILELEVDDVSVEIEKFERFEEDFRVDGK
nr:hypothetical protein [Staphylococcus epidermidis]